MTCATSMPSVTLPNAAYWPSRCGASSTMMKNWLPALFGRWLLAMESHAGGVLQIVLEAVHSEFTLDAVAGMAHAGAFRVAALDHKARNDTVEDGAVIKAVLNARNEV